MNKYLAKSVKRNQNLFSFTERGRLYLINNSLYYSRKGQLFIAEIDICW